MPQLIPRTTDSRELEIVWAQEEHASAASRRVRRLMRIRVFSHNIHKGFAPVSSKFVLREIREAIETTHAEIVFLQEVLGEHSLHARRVKDWPDQAQFEFLADRLWPHFAYGRNAVYTEGHHGNAILSKFPIVAWENEDISPSRLERRGLLHASIATPNGSLHAICVHLGLFEGDRRAQVARVAGRIGAMVAPEQPVIVAGDFNDWRMRATDFLRAELGLQEAFVLTQGRHARTFPSWLPALCLDRIYFRGLACDGAEIPAGLNGGSDHLPLMADFRLTVRS